MMTVRENIAPDARIEYSNLPPTRAMSLRAYMWGMQARYAPYLFVAPFLVLFSIFLVYPLTRSLVLSVHKTAGPNVQIFVGAGNYRFLFTDQLFWWATLNTIVYAILYLIVQIPLSLGLAMLVNSRRLRGREIFRFAFVTPNLIGAVFLGVIFQLFLWQRGPVNSVLGMLHLPRPDWLHNPNLVMVAVLMASVWASVGFGMLYCLAALQNVDRELYEAADIDGAGRFAKFLNVTLPGVRPVLMFLVLVGMISSLQLFELPYVLYSGAGPNNRAITIVMYLFNVGFELGDLGYASAIGWALVLLVAVLGMIGVRAISRVRN